MTRLDLLKILVGQARANGFEFRRWYTSRLDVPWISAEAAFKLLASQRRYYALLFSHEFASTFWKPGSEMTFQVDSQTFDRVLPDGTIASVTRKAFTRRSSRRDAWRYHLREMAAAEEPLRYMRKYLAVDEQLEDDPDQPLTEPTPAEPLASPPKDLFARKTPGPAPKRKPKPLPKGPPDFLRRP
jgi:hypothetical protein